jgi:hypothetical protein
MKTNSSLRTPVTRIVWRMVNYKSKTQCLTRKDNKPVSQHCNACNLECQMNR